MMARKLTLNLSDTWFVNDRWKWEETGQIHIVGLGDVPHSELPKVAETVREMLKEFDLPVQVDVSSVGAELLQCVNESKSEKRLDDDQLVRAVNRRRVTSSQFRAGLIILVSPRDFEPFARPGEKQQGIYGSSRADGVCLLRKYHKEAVRHELAHMLGLGEHCPAPSCVMRWECPTPVFCAACVKKLKGICETV